MKKSILFILLLFFWMTGFSQTLYFNGTPAVNGKESTRLYSLENLDNYIIATVEIEALKWNKSIKYWCTPNTFLYIGNIKYSQVVGYYVNGKIEQCGYNYQWGWSNVSEGSKNYYKLVFNGSIPPGTNSTISIIDEGETVWTNTTGYKNARSYSFSGYPISIPRKDYTSINNVNDAKKLIDENNDGICGIYEIIGGGSNYVLACIKDSEGYKLVYLSSSLGLPWWWVGDIKATLSKTPSGIFKARWYMSDKTVNNDAYIAFDGVSMTVTMTSGTDPGEKAYLKTYPENAPGSSGVSGGSEGKTWTGTGFALKGGYIITNHHVVDGAKTIQVLGVNGDPSIEYNAQVAAVDKNNDLALVKISDTRFGGFNHIPYAITNRICDVGEDVFVLGYPLTSYMGEEVKLTNGIISSKSGYQGDISTYQISAPVQPGNSGGPMFDSKGNVVGIVNAGIPGAENVGYAIKISYLYNLVESTVSSDIIPKNSSVPSGPLSDQVKSVKPFVFFIKCSGN